MATTRKVTPSTTRTPAKAPARTKAVVVESSILDGLPTAPASLARMTLPYARRIVDENVDGDEKLAVRVGLVLPFACDHTAEEIATKIFALYAKAGVPVPAEFGASTMQTAVKIARAWAEHPIAGKMTLGADLVPAWASLVRIARAAKADGGSHDVIGEVLMRADKGRTVGAKLGAIVASAAAVTAAANARRKGTRVAATVTDTAEGQAAITAHNERAADARVGETRTQRKARIAGQGTPTGGGNIGKGPVTPRTPESGADPLTPATPGNSTEQLGGQNPTLTGNSGPAKMKTLAEASTVELIRALRSQLGAGLRVTASLDEMFTVLTDEWEARALGTPASATPERERKAVNAKAAKAVAAKVSKQAREQAPAPEVTGRVGTSANVTALPSIASQMPNTAISRAWREAQAQVPEAPAEVLAAQA
jgi:hypothetical protein